MKDIGSIGFVIYMMVKRVDINISRTIIMYIIKKLYYKKTVWSVKKCPLDIPLKVSF